MDTKGVIYTKIENLMQGTCKEMWNSKINRYSLASVNFSSPENKRKYPLNKNGRKMVSINEIAHSRCDRKSAHAIFIFSGENTMFFM